MKLLLLLGFIGTFLIINVESDGRRLLNHESFHQLIPGTLRRQRSVLHNLAIDRMLRDRGFVMSVINCVLDKAPCDNHGRHLKRLVPEVLRGHCPGCDRNVRTQVRRVITHVQRNFPQLWTEVVHRFIHSVQHPSQSLHNVFG